MIIRILIFIGLYYFFTKNKSEELVENNLRPLDPSIDTNTVPSVNSVLTPVSNDTKLVDVVSVKRTVDNGPIVVNSLKPVESGKNETTSDYIPFVDSDGNRKFRNRTESLETLEPEPEITVLSGVVDPVIIGKNPIRKKPIVKFDPLPVDRVFPKIKVKKSLNPE